ncbi:hypothetical protein H2C83_11955, partial [Thermoactinomyces sp. AMNI-1]|nr:hypothetical protein [Thermoactinomyces mirandus]
IKPYATKVEEMLTEGPGVFAGGNYDQEKLEAELMKLPSNLTGEKAYQYLVHYLAEDYEPYVKKLDQFDTTYEAGAGPEGTVNQPPEAQQKKTNVVVLLDASGSMVGRVDGYTKMTLAKNAILRFAGSLPEQAHVSLRVYGHEGSNQKKDKEVSCKSTEQVYPLTPFKQDGYLLRYLRVHWPQWDTSYVSRRYFSFSNPFVFQIQECSLYKTPKSKRFSVCKNNMFRS